MSSLRALPLFLIACDGEVAFTDPVDTSTAIDTAEDIGEADADTDTDTDTDGDTDTDTGMEAVIDPRVIVFEEDFETASVGEEPAGWDNYVGWVVNNGNNNKGANVYAVVDDDKSSAGSQALHVVGGSNPAMIAKALPDDMDHVYVRVWMWSTEQLGMSPGRNHETIIALRAQSGANSNEVRFGEIKGIIGTNEVPTDDISPKYEEWGKGPVIASGGWRCLEVAFLADRTPHEVRAWADGVLVHEITSKDDWNNRVLGDEFLTGKFGEVLIGWHSFSNLSNEVWFDDLIVTTERVGCGG